ncbi:MAG: hypothetical protein PHW96_04890, partial [Candidatus Nanoarchaeia archaeon]|nr:hypothetical protein [Candidatus Nanoarchaeia archaeon]
MRRKGQAGSAAIVPGIMLLFLAFFLVYIFWIESSERSRLLGLTEPEDPSLQRILLTQEIGYIGSGLGGVISAHYFSDFAVSYPRTTNTFVSESKRYLQTWVFGKGISEHTYTKKQNVNALAISFIMEDVKGIPSINIILNGQTISSSTATKDSISSVEIQNTELSDENKIRIECVFNSWNIFETQSCLLSDFNITEITFEKGSELKNMELNILGSETDAGTAKISFDVQNSDTSGDLIIRINGVTMYRGKPAEITNIKEKGWDSLGLQSGKNTLIFEADKGGYYEIKNLKFESILSKETSASAGPFQFYVSRDVLNEASIFKIEFFAEEITPGDLVFTLSGIDVIPYEYCPSNMDGCSHINNNAWNTITISKNNVITGTNTVS